MKRIFFLIILAAGLLFGGAAASINEGLKDRAFKALSPVDSAGETLRARLLHKASGLGVSTEGRALKEIARDVKKKIQSKDESLRKYKAVIRSFSGAFVQYSPANLPLAR